MDCADQKSIAISTSIRNMVLTLLLVALKLLAGIFARSSAMISDAAHSASDLLVTLVVIVGVNLSHKKSDNLHPYGYERIECIAAFILSFILLATGVTIGIGGINNIISGLSGSLEVPGMFALMAAIVCIGIKEWMFRYTKRAAKKINSGALMADAWHHRIDALSSVGSLVGILGAQLGIPILDPIACVIICLFVIKVAVDIFIDAVKKLSDHSCDDKTLDEMVALILSQQGVHSLDSIKTRIFGTKIYVDVEIGVDATLSIVQAHDIAQKVHDELESRFERVKHCMIHVNPIT